MLALLPVAACNASDEAGSYAVPTDDGRGAVLVTTSIWADVVANLLCLPTDAVAPLMPLGTDPHGYQPTITAAEAIRSATLVISNGGGLEAALVPVLESAENNGTRIVSTSSLVSIVEDDPHIWLDPTITAQIIDDLADELISAGFEAGEVNRCTDRYRSALARLDAELGAMVSSLPERDRRLVTNHDALGYYARRYGLEVVGTILPSTSSLAQASPAELEELADTIDEEGLPAIFTEGGQRADEADALADRLGIAVVQLQTDTLGPPGTGFETYIDLMRTNTSLIVEALGSGA